MPWALHGAYCTISRNPVTQEEGAGLTCCLFERHDTGETKPLVNYASGLPNRQISQHLKAVS